MTAACTTVTKRVSLQSEEQTKAPKRKKMYEGREVSSEAEPSSDVLIDNDFFKGVVEEFKTDPRKIVARNTIVKVGVLPFVIDSDQSNKVNHIFLNTIKKTGVKATNQMHSGRCWMFAGLNTLRHLLIQGMGLKNFEFSETYLYFYDKIERADWFMQEIMRTKDVPLDNHLDGVNARYSDYLERILEKPIEDGGYWNYFANLVEKYGLIPKQAMEETANSCYSDEMNTELKRVLREAAFLLRKPDITPEQGEVIRKATLKKVADMMIIFMGTPPEKFDWSFLNSEGEAYTISGLTPQAFKAMVAPGINLSEDFIVLAHYPREDWPVNRVYDTKRDNNVIGGRSHRFLNLPITELKKYAQKSILKGLPVWFAGDVAKGFQPYNAALDEKLINFDLAFGKPLVKLNKAQRIAYQDTQACHAMTLLGVNLDEKGKATNWQVENSWGYFDDEEPGEDGFLSMSDDWFTENVFEIVVHKQFLTRTTSKLLKQEPIQLTSLGSAAH